jgi:hypothetical protein
MNGIGHLLCPVGVVVTSEKVPWLKPTERYALGVGVEGSSIRSPRTDLNVARRVSFCPSPELSS